MRIAALVVVALSGTAAADTAADIKTVISALNQRDTDKDHPRFAWSDEYVWWTGKSKRSDQPSYGAMNVVITKQVTALSGDGSAVWFAAEVKGDLQPDECMPGPCGPNKAAPHHVTGLLDKAGAGWTWIAWHSAPPTTAKQEAWSQKSVAPDAITKSTTGAEDVAAVFEASLKDPKALAESISDRKDVVLYGSASAERTVGGDAVKKKLGAWKLTFKVRDGIHAGLAANKSVAYVAANVDAVSLKKPNDKPMPYRLFAIYEKTGGAWKLVLAHFSVDTD